MRRGTVAPPAIVAPAPRQPSFGSVAAKAQALAPGCMNPNKPALWAFAGSKLRILEVPRTRYKSQEEEYAAIRAKAQAAASQTADDGAEPAVADVPRPRQRRP